MAPLIVKVPRTPRRAFDKSRTPSSLVRTQAEHLQEVMRTRVGGNPDAPAPRKARTEGQLATLVESLTKTLHPEGATPVELPPDAVRPVGLLKRPARKARKTTKRRARAGGKKR